MAQTVLSQAFPTIVDLANYMAPDGSIADVVELLRQSNPMLDTMSWMEGNLTTGHQTTQRTGLPPVTWRSINTGVTPGKSSSMKVTDECGMLEAYTIVDKALADLGGNTAAFRLQEERAYIAALSNEMQRVLVYGNSGVLPDSFTGIIARFNAISGATNATNIIAGTGASTDNASILLVYWGPNTATGIVPKGSKAGLQVTDKGLTTIQVTGAVAGSYSEAYQTHYRWDAGLSVRNWQGIVRVCNIKKGTLTKNAATGDDLSDLMYQALEAVPPWVAGMGKPAWYMSRNTLSFLRRQMLNKTAASTLEWQDVGGVHTEAFHGIPIGRVDAMAADEALVS